MRRLKFCERISLLLILLLSLNCVVTAQNPPQLTKTNIKKVVSAMTLEEKASVVVGAGMNFGPPPSSQNNNQGAPGGTPPPGGNADAPGAPAGPGGPVVGDTKTLVSGAAGTTHGVERLGINPTVVSDGPAGIRINPTRPNDDNTYYCTAFPVGTLLASTWNTELVSQVGMAMGDELLEYGIDILLGPGMNIQRNPLCGRNFEYYSEDPYVTGKIAAAMVNGIQSKGVGACIKHYVVNNAETNRNTLNVIAGQRALREIYLEGWRIAVTESQPWTVMSSYNLLNGTYTSEEYDLLTSVLRNDFGFEGYVMTDWMGGKDPVAQMKAGNDLLMPGNQGQQDAIIKAVKEGALDEKVLDQNVERILNIVVKGPRFNGYDYSNKPDLKANAKVTRQSATEGMVLLKNDNSTLPFAKEVKNLAVFGNTSYDIISGGTGSGDVNEAYSVSLVEGLQNVGYSVNGNLQTMYDAYTKAVKDGQPKRRMFMFGGQEPTPEILVNPKLAKSLAEVADAAIITIGRNSGEGSDRKAEAGDFNLTGEELEMINNVSAAFKAKDKKVVVILNVGGAVETASWKAIPDAILLAWQGGQETGNSIADILSGAANPSGKLAVTFPKSYADVPTSETFPGKELPSDEPEDGRRGFMRGRPAEDTYTDGIYVGYRYYETFDVEPSYEFGYGLSYTNFEYSGLKLSSTKFSKNITVTVDVKNAGDIAGKEVVQLYLSAPNGKMDKPAEELKGFAKTALLQPGESETLSFVIDAQNLASFDVSRSAWVAEAGDYKVKIGASSRDIKVTADFSLAKEKVVNKESNVLAPPVKIDELSQK
ncbi:glycoside hydrolase family 3 C-terminal domain-containing protein [Draconibacterium sp. IB214405]|uniref:beta-glucosidase n=1 Tax=Draconibacterium sp. IB214405 TaxID=3097352 RepID=UPI002A0ED2BD|nr:glycoside hydrolase family 3 C-terminal domain-containing protein [Draconibacterium sp. IB214405]MDX8339096.1 glycoside hydrolase family 3 C-terminal domain-containing protein [Draconibacterium sp. IB214405]